MNVMPDEKGRCADACKKRSPREPKRKEKGERWASKSKDDQKMGLVGTQESKRVDVLLCSFSDSFPLPVCTAATPLEFGAGKRILVVVSAERRS